jgi:ABC-2 type transport system ATP-binding protein
MHDPPVLLLDEPEASLDESARGALLRFLEAEARRGDRTIVFSTHLTAESGRLADRVTHLDLGRIVRGSP